MLVASVFTLVFVPSPLRPTVARPSRPAVAAAWPTLPQPFDTLPQPQLRPQPQQTSPRMAEAVDTTEQRKRGTNLVVLIIATTVALQFEWRFFLGFAAGVAVDKLARKMEGIHFLPEGLKPPRAAVSKATIGEEIYTEISWLPDD